MFERFSDRARKAMQLANEAAQRLNHEYIGTEHMLLGLVRENSGVASAILSFFKITPQAVCEAVEGIVQLGPNMVTMGKLAQTPRARRALQFAIEQAASLKCGYVGTEHLLLGILREEEGVGAQVLVNLGMELETVHQMIVEFRYRLAEVDEATTTNPPQPTQPEQAAPRRQSPWKFCPHCGHALPGLD